MLGKGAWRLALTHGLKDNTNAVSLVVSLKIYRIVDLLVQFLGNYPADPTNINKDVQSNVGRCRLFRDVCCDDICGCNTV